MGFTCLISSKSIIDITILSYCCRVMKKSKKFLLSFSIQNWRDMECFSLFTLRSSFKEVQTRNVVNFLLSHPRFHSRLGVKQKWQRSWPTTVWSFLYCFLRLSLSNFEFYLCKSTANMDEIRLFLIKLTWGISEIMAFVIMFSAGKFNATLLW